MSFRAGRSIRAVACFFFFFNLDVIKEKNPPKKLSGWTVWGQRSVHRSRETERGFICFNQREEVGTSSPCSPMVAARANETANEVQVNPAPLAPFPPQQPTSTIRPGLIPSIAANDANERMLMNCILKRQTDDEFQRSNVAAAAVLIRIN